MSKEMQTKLETPKPKGYPYLAWYNPHNENLKDDDPIVLIADVDGCERVQCTNLITGDAYITCNEHEYTRLPVGSVFSITQS